MPSASDASALTRNRFTRETRREHVLPYKTQTGIVAALVARLRTRVIYSRNSKRRQSFDSQLMPTNAKRHIDFQWNRSYSSHSSLTHSHLLWTADIACAAVKWLIATTQRLLFHAWRFWCNTLLLLSDSLLALYRSTFSNEATISKICFLRKSFILKGNLKDWFIII